MVKLDLEKGGWDLEKGAGCCCCVLQDMVFQLHSKVLGSSPRHSLNSVTMRNEGASIADCHSYIPTGIVATHVFTVGYLSVVVLRTIYRSYIALPPSSATRFREPLRQGYVHAFSLLAFVSLATATYFGVRFGSLSYRVWATERGIGLPDEFVTPSTFMGIRADDKCSLFGDSGALRGGEHPGRLQVVQWLNDTPLYRDALEIVAEKARYFWWGQQINLALISWSTYLAIEGQRRKISNLWAFLALAQLVNVSCAQNLFFITVLLTPVPLPGNVRDLTRSSVPSWGR